MTTNYKITGRSEKPLSEWVTLVSKTVESPSYQSPQEFHSFKQADYVNVLPITSKDEIILVRQFRPALERETLELPGGLLEADDDPEDRVRIELFEETGYSTTEPLIRLGVLDPDTGRLENKLRCYVARNVIPDPDNTWKPESGIEVLKITKEELIRMVNSGEFSHALHIAIIGLAVIKKYITLP